MKIVEQTTPRPAHKTPVDVDLIYKLAAIHCTNTEIASIVGIHYDSLRRHYSDVIEAGKESGKSKLRRKMWEQAMKGNVTMLVWLSKNHLGFSDNPVSGEDNQPLPWTDSDDENTIAESATTESDADTIVVTPVRENLAELAADLAKI